MPASTKAVHIHASGDDVGKVTDPDFWVTNGDQILPTLMMGGQVSAPASAPTVANHILGMVPINSALAGVILTLHSRGTTPPTYQMKLNGVALHTAQNNFPGTPGSSPSTQLLKPTGAGTAALDPDLCALVYSSAIFSVDISNAGTGALGLDVQFFFRPLINAFE